MNDYEYFDILSLILWPNSLKTHECPSFPSPKSWIRDDVIEYVFV